MHQLVSVERSWVEAELGYLSEDAVDPEVYLCQPPAGVSSESGGVDLRRVRIHGARSAGSSLTLEREGFTFVRDSLPGIDYEDADQVQSVYYPRLVDMALSATGGREAYVFDHLVRQRDPDVDMHLFGRRGAGERVGALGRVHTDYTEKSGQLRRDYIVETFGLNSLPRLYCIVNLWRSIGGVIEDSPLAFCAANSVSTHDLVPSKLHYRHRVGEIYQVTHNANHHWWHLENMSNEDVAIFKQFDSRVSGVARMVPHSAFSLPTAMCSSTRRRSIEARVFVVLQ